ncbi:MAG TPA: TonB-dependent receptor, partial [Usitatibacter sp.]|nr:TonB-dependent receptor [Usitatibacter sp.]
SDGGPDFDDRTNTTLESYSVSSRNRLGERWTSTLTAGEGRDDSISISSFGESPFETRQRQYAWQNDLTLPAGLVSLVLERREEKLATTNDFAVTTRDTDSVGAIYQLQQGPWSLQANLRRDDSSQYDAQTTGGIAGGYKAGDWRFTAGYSTGFRPPSFNDLYFPGFSNPNLLPEKARNAEVGAYWTHAMAASRIEARAVAYRNRVEDLIVFGCDADFNCRPDNVDRATLQGVTLGLDAFFGATRVAASVDIQRPEDEATGNLLPRRARRHGAVQASHAWGPVRVSAEVVASSYRFDDAANTVRMGGYAVFNATADWQVSRSWALYVRGNNLFDRDYQLAADYSTGGASVIAGVRASF